MAESKGRLFVLKLGDGEVSETFTVIGGLRTTSITINGAPVDVTTKDSAPWRKLLADTGIKSVSISGAGIFQDDAIIALIRTACLGQELNNFQVVNGSTGDIYEGAFQVTNFSENAPHDNAVDFSISLESSGAITFTPA